MLFTLIFVALGAWGIHKGWAPVARNAWFAAAAVVGLVTLTAPRLLAPFNLAWFKLGLLMGMVVSPIVLGIIFFVILTPVAIVSRLFGRDELRLKRNAMQSYWVDRVPPGPDGDSFKNQF